MNIDIMRLKCDIDEYIDIDETLTIELDRLKGTGILELLPLNIKGTITKDRLDKYNIALTIKGKMILPCSITLKPVDYPIEIEINDDVEKILSEINENNEKIENTIDIFPIIWENILMEIPLKVTSPDAKDLNLSGDGWKLVKDEPNQATNSAFEKLKDLL